MQKNANTRKFNALMRVARTNYYVEIFRSIKRQTALKEESHVPNAKRYCLKMRKRFTVATRVSCIGSRK
jgi:hypothetical protein